MGKPTGFMEYQRQAPADRSPAARIADWEEFRQPLTREEMRRQGARCMDCGIPFCHLGESMPHNSPFASGCPLNNLIPEWNDLIYRDLWKEALERLHKTNNFPEFTGRVCPAPCESACVLGIDAPPVTIKNNEGAIADTGFAQGWVVAQPPARRTGRRVAVVGSGPAGLACAAQLNKAGHRVSVYERADRIGGLLTYGIPNMKLDKRLVQRRVELLAAEGIEFVTGVEIGKDIPASQLVERFDAVALCLGATRPRELAVEGRPLKGIHQAIDFLNASTRMLLDQGQTNGHSISAKDKRVIVLGGGDTGTDCVATALRQGCRSVLQFDIIPEPPHQRAADNPWPEWPRVYRVEYGQQEAMARFGEDPRQYLLSTVRFAGDPQGPLTELDTMEVEWVKGADGRPFREVPGTEKRWPVELALLSLGWCGPEDLVLEQLGVERDARTNARAAYGRFATNVPGVFAAGDVRRGASLVVWAIAEGRGAAREVDRYLMGSTDLP